MEDRFKFRAWNQIVNRMSDVFTMDNLIRNVQWQNLILMQSTGLKDKNGKLIFEGDIVEDYYINNKRFVGVVIWWNDRWAISFDPSDEENTGSLMCFPTCEIIGNIHENPELLEAKNDNS